MRHRKAGVKLGRTGSHRNAMFRNMVTSLLKHDRIQTTDTKAKELRRWVDHVITLAKRGDLHARRQALAIVRDKTVVHKLFDRVQELFGGREGGYTRLIKVGRRAGDAAPMTMIELIIPEDKEADKKKKDKAAKKQPPASVSDATAQSDKQTEVASQPETQADKPAETAVAAAGPEEGNKEA
jgi:large subunit ribosomal protein L17